MTTDTNNLASALAKVQAALPTVHKGKTARIESNKGSYGYSYADLSDVTAAVMPLLAKHGLSFTCLPRLTEKGGYELAAKLMHTSGEHVEGALPIAGGTPQQIGSAITYARRYLLGCMTGVVTDDDDDARAATDAAKEARRQVHQQVAAESVPRITDAQKKHMHALLGELGIKDREKYVALAAWVVSRELESTGDLSKSEAAKVIDYLTERVAKEKADAAAKGADDAAA